jgi:hypothetical protein
MVGCSGADKPSWRIEHIDRIMLMPPTHWCLSVRHDGSVEAQYGSSSGDHLVLPAGSVDFVNVLELAEKLVANRRSDGNRSKQLVVCLRTPDGGFVSYEGVDDSLFRSLLKPFDDKWQPGIACQFPERLKVHPMFRDTKGDATRS